MVIGFTGTSKGMSSYQKERVLELLKLLNPDLVRHGDGIGSDTEFHEISRTLNIPTCIHPPEDERKRAFNCAKCVLPPKGIADRNKDIVEKSNLLIATPQSATEMAHSQVWSTVRYARELGVVIILCVP